MYVKHSAQNLYAENANGRKLYIFNYAEKRKRF